MTKISAYLPGFEEKSQLARQIDAANQRDSWLRQMELAQLSEMDQAGDANASGTNANKAAPSASWRSILQPHTANATEDRQQSSSPTHNQTSHNTVQSDIQSVTPVHAQTTNDAATQNQDARQSTNAAGSQNKPISHSAIVSLSDQAATRIDNAAILDSLPATQMGGVQAGAAQTFSAPQSVGTPIIQAAQSRAPALPALPTTMADCDQPEPTSTQDEAAQEETPSADFFLEEKPTWQKRLMHMTGEGQDVKLWIRDSELDTAQSRNLVYRLASDIAGMGMQLKNVTVNGRLAFRSGDDPDAVSGPSAQGRLRRTVVARDQGLGAPHATDSFTPTMEE